MTTKNDVVNAALEFVTAEDAEIRYAALGMMPLESQRLRSSQALTGLRRLVHAFEAERAAQEKKP